MRVKDNGDRRYIATERSLAGNLDERSIHAGFPFLGWKTGCSRLQTAKTLQTGSIHLIRLDRNPAVLMVDNDDVLVENDEEGDEDGLRQNLKRKILMRVLYVSCKSIRQQPTGRHLNMNSLC